MPKHPKFSYAVIHVPFYRLQCALLQRTWQKAETLPASARAPEPPAPVWKNIPVALLDEEGQLGEVNPAAAAEGIIPGMTTSLAIARLPQLLLLARAPACEQQLQNTLLQLASQHSPSLENTGPGICTLDFSCHRLHQPEPALRELLQRLELLGLTAQAGLGPNPELARQAANVAQPFLAVEANSSFLQQLPLTSLDCSAYLSDILQSWGITTLGAFTQLPREEVGQRLGLEGMALWDRAAGRSANIIQVARLPESFLESIDFENALETLEPLLFVLRRFLERLALRIEAIYQLIAEIRLTLGLEHGDPITRQLTIPAPTRQVESLFRVATQYLETVQTSSPIVRLDVEAFPSSPGNQQLDLFSGGLKDPNRFFQTLARLAALIGAERIGLPERLNTHRPDSVRLRWPDFDWTGAIAPTEAAPAIGPALRRCRPGVMAKVELRNGRPQSLQSSLASGRIRAVRGPWKLAGQWWDQDRWAITEWDVQLDNGTLYRLAQTETEWRIAGCYD